MKDSAINPLLSTASILASVIHPYENPLLAAKLWSAD